MFQIMRQVFAAQSQTDRQGDPLVRARQILAQNDPRHLRDMEAAIQREIQQVVAAALQPEGGVA